MAKQNRAPLLGFGSQGKTTFLSWRIKKNDREVVFRIDQIKMPDAQARHFI